MFDKCALSKLEDTYLICFRLSLFGPNQKKNADTEVFNGTMDNKNV